MPSIKFETSAVLTREEEKSLALEITALSSQLLNKPVEVIQVRVSSGMTVTFGGSDAGKSAFLAIALVGNIAPEVKAVLPEKFAAIFDRYGIDRKKLFLHYTETPIEAWGWL